MKHELVIVRNARQKPQAETTLSRCLRELRCMGKRVLGYEIRNGNIEIKVMVTK